ncbi:MAG: 5'-methylthioadenosine/adenosylhomocysteine nucleosidase [Elusimicrobiaceae bacterium]|nr:5'-methylthioadenosine/adenosylhomocysteine nucleosidase [Elusimicrobiaceae bacterium]
MKKIGIICALAHEKEQLVSRLQTHQTTQEGPFVFTRGELNGCEIILLQSGIGKVNAALGTLEMIKNFNPDYIINSGVAGGLQPTLNTMDSVIGSQYVYHDVWCGVGNDYGQVQELPTFFQADKMLLTLAEKLHAQNPAHVHTGLICTGDQFVSGEEPVSKILQHFPNVLACDMESTAIAQVCYRYHVPFLSMRLISDVAGKDATNMTQYENFWQTMAERGFERTWGLLSSLTAEFVRQ